MMLFSKSSVPVLRIALPTFVENVLKTTLAVPSLKTAPPCPVASFAAKVLCMMVVMPVLVV
jgi:hypothetical protein